MLQISPISYTANENQRKTAQEKREDIRDTAVAGGAAGAGYSAAKSGGLKLNMAKKLKEASSTSANTTKELSRGIKTIQESKQAVTNVANEAAGLFRSFKNNAKVYSDRILSYMKNMKAGKFIKRVIDTPVVKGGCRVFGGVLAACVLFSGFGTLYSNTTKVVDNYAPKLADNFNRIADAYNKQEGEFKK